MKFQNRVGLGFLIFGMGMLNVSSESRLLQTISLLVAVMGLIGLCLDWE